VLIRTKAVYVVARKELYVYELVTEGRRQDIGMAYDLSVRHYETPPTMISTDHGNVVVEQVSDLVELDKVREQLGLYRSNLFSNKVNALWRALGLDNVPQARGNGGTLRLYRVGHPDHRGGFF